MSFSRSKFILRSYETIFIKGSTTLVDGWGPDQSQSGIQAYDQSERGEQADVMGGHPQSLTCDHLIKKVILLHPSTLYFK